MTASVFSGRWRRLASSFVRRLSTRRRSTPAPSRIAVAGMSMSCWIRFIAPDISVSRIINAISGEMTLATRSIRTRSSAFSFGRGWPESARLFRRRITPNNSPAFESIGAPRYW
ncbi:MAG: hypothetical protein HZB38_03145 [Planctomycetes bacterium]|nr:hypothetical protein [Planctomycetota bacterium]